MATGSTKGTKTTSKMKTTKAADKGTSKAKTTKTTTTKAEEQVVTREPYEFSEAEKKLINEIVLIAGVLVTLLLILSNFGVLSPFGDYLRYFMFGLFGFVAYLFPIVLFIGVAFYISNKNNRKCIFKMVSGGATYLFVAALIQLVFMEYDGNTSVFEYYNICGKGLTGGGFFGAMIEKMFHSVIGTLGTYIVLIVLLIIAIVCLTEKSFIGGVKKSSSVVYETARTETAKVKKNAKKRAEERAYQKKEKRMDKQVRGVAIHKVSDGEPEEDCDVHEINGEVLNKATENAELYQGHVEIDEADFENGYDYNHDIYNDSVEEVYVAQKTDPQANVVVDNSITSTVKNSVDSDGYTTINNRNNTVFSGKNDNASNGCGVLNSANDESHIGEDGLFEGREKIQVSQSAKNIMNRKAFSTGTESTLAGAGSTMPTGNTLTGAGSSLTTSNTTSVGIGGRSDAASQQPKPPVKKIVKNYRLPSTNLLNKNTNAAGSGNNGDLKEMAERLGKILENFGVNAKVVDYCRGPSVTRYEIQPEIGTRLNKVTSLADDIKLNLGVTDIRIEPVAGKTTIGIEVPNDKRESVLIRELIESKELRGNNSKIAFAAGKDIAGDVVLGDIAKMPHLLVAGTTGSGKSVFTNSIIMSILFRAKPSEVRLIIVDPKVVEFGVYNGIPHLLQPVVTDPKLASNTLKWAVNEMSERYKKFADFNVRDMKGYNEKVETIGKDMGLEKLPQIVIVIDELADLMMVAAKEVEESICRLAQLARAAGIHLIIATQRPSVDVVTGLIKANIPSRCALMVSSGVDSRTIIDSNGAEKLLGNGDMLFYPSGYLKPVRLQGAFVSDAEVQRVVDFWKEQAGEVTYDSNLINYEPAASITGGASNDERDDYFFEAAKFVIEKERASTSMIQRMFKIGFNRAARIMDQLCEAGIVGEEEGTKPRKVLKTLDELEQMKNM